MHNKILKKYYFINSFDPRHLNSLDKNILLIYRNYTEKIDENLIIKIKQYCKKNRRKIFLSNNFKLAIKLDLNGVYLPSFNKDLNSNSFKIKKNFKIIGSAHNLKDIKIKEAQNVQELFIGSLFRIKKTYLGIYKFKNLVKLTKTPVVALGGIKDSNLRILNLLTLKVFQELVILDPKKKGPLLEALRFSILFLARMRIP